MERGNEFAPNNRDDLLEMLGSTACSGECFLAVCTQDRHHMVWGTDLSDAERLLRNHPDFILPQVCRAKHETLHKRFDRSEPVSDEFVIGYYIASPANMSKTRIKNIKKLRRSL